MVNQSPTIENAVTVYKEMVIPFLKHRCGSIISASLLVWFIAKLDNILRPPENLRHIPYFGLFGMIRSLVKKERYTDIALSTSLLEINSPGSKGVYIKPGRYGWPIYVTTPSAVKKVFLHNDFFPKRDVASSFPNSLIVRYAGGSSIFLANGGSWKYQRKVANPAFNRSMPVQLFGTLTQDLFCTIDKLGETVNWSDLTLRWTLDAIGLAGFGFDFEAIKNKQSRWVLTYEKINKGISDALYHALPFLDSHFLWLLPKRRAIHQELDQFLEMIDGIIERRRQELKKGENLNTLINEKDILTLLLEAEAGGEGGLSNAELKRNLCIFLFAGHDTTASALSAAVYYLAKNQDIQQRARVEAISILGNEPEDVLPTIEQTKKMKYINQIMKETLRMNTPAPQSSPRIASEDTELGGVFIPKGSSVIVNMHDLHHSESVWKDSFVFNPERFADTEGSRVSEGGASWTPFGYGGRQCIGMNFSLNEQRVVLSMMLRKFTFTLPEDSIHKEKIVSGGTIVMVPSDLKITFKKRY